MAFNFSEKVSNKNPNCALIVDALNLAFRWKHQGRTDFRYEYQRTVQSLARSYDCEKIIMTADWGSSSYRKQISPDYKQNRKDKFADQSEEEKIAFEEFFEEYEESLALLKEDYPLLRFKGVEADDIAALICQNRENIGVDEIWMISSDKDWDLLVDEKISRFSTVTRKETTLLNWDEHYDFDPYYYLTYKALTGDKGDNVPGVDGVGPKRATQLIEQYGDVFDIMASLPLEGKYKYIENLNAFGTEGLEAGVKLMDLTYDVDAAVLGHGQEIIGLVENYVSEDRL